jgi:PAS domain S-box-containing protein
VDAYFRTVTETICELIIVAARDGSITYVTPSIRTVLGFDPAERAGHRIGETMHPDDRARFADDFRDLLREGSLNAAEYRFQHQNGSWRTVEVRGRNLLDDRTVRALIFNGRDVTERKRMQKELAQLNRLTSIGRLSAQVVHEFNNVLMALQTSLGLLRRRVADDPQLTRLTDTMTHALGRGKCVTRDLLRYLAPAQVSQTRIDARDLLRRAGDEIQQLLGTIGLVLQIPEAPLVIEGDAQQLSQVFINLALNARDAMQGGGTLTISADGPDAERFIRFIVTDTGEGIEQQDLQHIFEPLFTTKQSGTGLGLSVVRQIVSAHGGHVFAKSEKGRGTSFYIYIPAVPE